MSYAGYRASYYQAHRDRIREVQRRYDATPAAKAKRREAARKRRATQQPKINAYQRDWRRERNQSGLYTRLQSIQENYGLSETAFWELWAAQKGCCAICGCALSLGNMKQDAAVTVDHDHASGKVRGLLCRKHNLLLGHADDKISILQHAIRYLQNDGVE
jgi:Recombination endonuclease VII